MQCIDMSCFKRGQAVSPLVKYNGRVEQTKCLTTRRIEAGVVDAVVYLNLPSTIMSQIRGDLDGVSTYAYKVSPQGEIFTASDWLDRLAAGLTNGNKSLFKFGRGDVTTTELPVWSETGAYPFPLANEALTVSSANAGDVGAEITASFLMDDTYTSLPDTTVTLNGQNAVPLVSAFRCSRAWVKSGSIVGPVYIGYGALTAGKPANVLARIDAVDNQTMMAIYTTDKDHSMTIHNVSYDTDSAKVATCSGFMSIEGGPIRRVGEIITRDGKAKFASKVPVTIPPKTDFYLTLKYETGSGTASCYWSAVVMDMNVY